MVLAIIGLIILLLLACVAAFTFWNKWHVEKLDRARTDQYYDDLSKEVDNLRWLLIAGWKIDLDWSLDFTDLSQWRLTAPDESRSRYLTEAMERQRELEKVRRLNLPEVLIDDNARINP